MQLALNDIIPISQARARLTELADEVATHGRPKLLTRNGTGYVALVTATELDELERFRAAAWQSNFEAVVAALPEIQAGQGMAVDEFKKRSTALISKLGKSKRIARRLTSSDGV